ncbi:MAG TPA: type IV pilin-like G/H family protein [Leptolyngbyaceae cyanobacterium]
MNNRRKPIGVSRVFKNQSDGFTLPELLVVLFIITILSAIALPSFLKQVNKAKQAEAQIKIKTFYTSQESFYLENAAFTNSPNYLNNALAESQNYRYYTFLFDRGQIAIHVAEPKNPTLPYYGGGVYFKNDRNGYKQIQTCGPLSTRNTSFLAVVALVRSHCEL